VGLSFEKVLAGRKWIMQEGIVLWLESIVLWLIAVCGIASDKIPRVNHWREGVDVIAPLNLSNLFSGRFLVSCWLLHVHHWTGFFAGLLRTKKIPFETAGVVESHQCV